MNEIVNFSNYHEYKKTLDGELQKTAESFVRIGYLLKVARDTRVLEESGYKSVAEFAQAEYNLDKTQVSRFIAINDQYSEGGYSDHLLPEWQGYGYAKLTIMMQIPETIAVELSPSYSKAEIQAIKEEIDEEKKKTDLEVLMEPRKTQLEELNLTEKVFYILLKDDRELYKKCHKINSPGLGIEDYDLKKVLAPSGEKVYSVRIPATGRVMLILDDTKEEATIVNTRSEEKVVITWKDMGDAIYKMFNPELDSVEQEWEWYYGENWPDMKVAPVQQPQKLEPRKESKVQKAKTPEKPKKTSTETQSAAAVEQTQEEQLPGQMNVTDYPELMPEAKFEEIKEERDERDNESGVPDCTGNETDHGESGEVEETAGGEAESAHEGDGTSESGGCEADHEYKEMKPFWEALEDIGNAMERLEAMFPEKDFDDKLDAMNIEELKAAHKEALKLAAGIEKMMIWRHLKNEG